MNKKKKSTGLSLKTTTALIIIVFLLGLGGTLTFYSFYKILNIQFYDIQLEVIPAGRHAGFNADPTLNFGKLPVSGGKAMKEINTHNYWDDPVLVSIRIKGNATGFIQVTENDFVLQPGEGKTVRAYAVVPRGYEHTGIYTGTAKVVTLRV